MVWSIKYKINQWSPVMVIIESLAAKWSESDTWLEYAQHMGRTCQEQILYRPWHIL